MEAKESTLKVNAQFEVIQQNQFYMPTWALISVLIVGFFILKSFIYIKDGKRHGR